jgi:beta-lactamase regulating signal transducer with metallopeptidase domain
MNATEILGGPVSQAVGLALLHLLWQGAVMAGLLAATLALLSRLSANVRYVVSCAALALLLGFGVATAIRSYEPRVEVSELPSARQPQSLVAELNAADGAPVVLQKETWREKALDAALTLREQTPYIVLVWLAGVLLLTTRLTISWHRAQSLARRLTAPAPLDQQAVITRLSAALGLRRAVQLLESVSVEVPSVVGWLRPVILVPASGLTGFTAQQIEMIFAHELAHIRRHDFLVNVLQSLAETLLFYHPAAWWISRRIRIERENCCDDLAVSVCGNALQYARALTQLEQLRAADAALVASTGGSLFARVRRIVGMSEHHRLVNGWTAAAAAFVFVTLFSLATVPARAQKETPPPPPLPPAAPTPAGTPAPRAPRTPRVTVDVPAPTPVPTPIAPRAPRVVTVVAAPIAEAVEEGVAGAMVGAIDIADLDIDIDIDYDSDDDDQEPARDPSGKLTIDELIALRVAGITTEYIESMRKTLGSQVSIRDLSSLRLQGVTPEYVRDMRAIWGDKLTAREIISLKVQAVDAKWLSEMKAAGVEINSAREAVALKVHDVSPAFVRALREAGYDKISARDLARLAAAGVNADFIREMARYRKDQK